MKTIIFLLALMVLFSCGKDKKKEKLPGTISRDSITITNKVSDVIAVGKVRPDAGFTDLSSIVAGKVEAKYISEGDTVHEGQLLVKLKDVDQRDQLANLSAQIETQKKRIRSDELQLGQYKIKIVDKERTLNSSEALAEEGAETAENVQNLKNDITLLTSDLGLAQQKIQIGKSQLEEMKTRYAAAQNDLWHRQLRAPADGKLIDVDVEKGEVLQNFKPYATLIPPGHLVVWGEVDELFANQLRDGMEVTIKYIGYLDSVAHGKITYLSPVLENKSLFSDEPGEKQDRLVRRFKVGLSGEPALLINAKVQCVIKLKSDVADSH